MTILNNILLHAFLISAVLLFSAGESIQAAETPPEPAITELQISAGEWPPFLSASLPQQGAVALLIRDLFAEVGLKVSFTFLPWARAYHDTTNGKYVATAVWMFSQDRTKDFLYSDAILDEKFVFFHLKQRPFDWQQLSDLQGLLLGGGLGYSYGHDFDQAVSNGVFKISRVGSTEQNFRRLLAGRIDAFAEEISVGYHTLIHQLPEQVNAISHHPKPLLINQSFLLFPRNHPESEQLRILFNQQLQQFKHSGRYETYFEPLLRRF